MEKYEESFKYLSEINRTDLNPNAIRLMFYTILKVKPELWKISNLNKLFSHY